VISWFVGNPVVVELKKGVTPKTIVAQVLNYMNLVKQKNPATKRIRAIVVCEREQPTVKSAFQLVPDVKILYWY
jgi:small nuclear ribonucleoprotein (snRNP)-like protein